MNDAGKDEYELWYNAIVELTQDALWSFFSTYRRPALEVTKPCSSSWSAALALAGSLNLYSALKGTGCYFARLQASHNNLLPSRLLLGIEADISFPNTIAGV